MTGPSLAYAEPWQPCAAPGWSCTSAKRLYEIWLGKMLQPQPLNTTDHEVPYLKALHVQWTGVQTTDLPTMWASPTEIEANRVQQGDLLICEGGEVGRAARLALPPPADCILQNALHRARPRTDQDVRYLAYILRHAADHGWFEVLCNKATIAHFTAEKFGEMRVCYPVASVQHAIADYLDRETAQIDALVAAKERVLGLLAEKRRALITRAITKGLNPTVALRDSRIAWLGEIPAHWETERAKWLFRERDQRSTSGSEELLTVSHITGVTPRAEKEVFMFEAETTEGYKLCHEGDLVINTLWAWMGAMGVSPVDGIVSPAYNVYEPGPRLDRGFVDSMVRIPIFAQEVTRYSKGVWSSRLRLYPEGLFEVLFPVPPLEEQRAIVAHIAAETAKLDALRTATERTIALLKERRTALIAAAVTGQIDVGA